MFNYETVRYSLTRALIDTWYVPESCAGVFFVMKLACRTSPVNISHAKSGRKYRHRVYINMNTRWYLDFRPRWYEFEPGPKEEFLKGPRWPYCILGTPFSFLKINRLDKFRLSAASLLFPV